MYTVKSRESGHELRRERCKWRVQLRKGFNYTFQGLMRSDSIEILLLSTIKSISNHPYAECYSEYLESRRSDTAAGHYHYAAKIKHG